LIKGADILFTDNFEKYGVTADSKKVLPGMVYVDLHENKSRKEIYHAYNNGASVIFTTQNISNPELPVIKVNNVYETLLFMLNNHFHNPQNKLKLVAVSGSNDKDIILDLLYKILGEKDRMSNPEKEKEFMNYFSSLNKLTIEDMYEHLDKVAAKGEHFMPIIVDYKLKYFRFMKSFEFDCALISGVNTLDMGDQTYVLESIRSFISQIPENRPIIVNNDDDIVLKALESSKNTIVITYGLNKKAAVTATSIDLNQQTTFNFCLQRSFTTNNGNLLEPFEMPIRMNMHGSRSVQNALAVITCALYYDIDIEEIKAVLQSYVSPSRRFQISNVNGITILDNYCSTLGDLDKTLDGLQLLNYNKLGLLISVNKNEDWQEQEGIIRVLNQWSSILGLKEVVICGCVDVDEKIPPLSINDIRRFKKALNDLMEVRYFDKLQNAIEYLTGCIKTGDLLTLAGGDEMNKAKAMLEYQLKHVLENLH
jgi:UDP-N-acetylmuramoyl-L-alanyl-D-glutamate--2,6-diaminopimelate ligase